MTYMHLRNHSVRPEGGSERLSCGASNQSPPG